MYRVSKEAFFSIGENGEKTKHYIIYGKLFCRNDFNILLCLIEIKGPTALWRVASKRQSLFYDIYSTSSICEQTHIQKYIQFKFRFTAVFSCCKLVNPLRPSSHSNRWQGDRHFLWGSSAIELLKTVHLLLYSYYCFLDFGNYFKVFFS